jgi:hypothetical protein
MDLGCGWNYCVVHHPAQRGEVMGWQLWKSFGFGPLRTTLSNRGIGWNIGTSFLRFGVGPPALSTSSFPYRERGLASSNI